ALPLPTLVFMVSQLFSFVYTNPWDARFGCVCAGMSIHGAKAKRSSEQNLIVSDSSTRCIEGASKPPRDKVSNRYCQGEHLHGPERMNAFGIRAPNKGDLRNANWRPEIANFASRVD